MYYVSFSLSLSLCPYPQHTPVICVCKCITVYLNHKSRIIAEYSQSLCKKNENLQQQKSIFTKISIYYTSGFSQVLFFPRFQTFFTDLIVNVFNA